MTHPSPARARSSSSLPVLAVALAFVAAPLHAQTHVVGWGSNRYDSAWATEIFVAVSAGYDTTAAARADGSLAAWGEHGAAMTGAPALPPGVGVVEVAAGRTQCIELLSDGSFVLMPGGQRTVPTVPAEQVAAGSNFFALRYANGQVGVLGDNSYGQLFVPPLPAGVQYVEVACGVNHVLARRSDGAVVSWGSMTLGATPPPGLAFVRIAAGQYHNVAIRSDGTLQAWGIADIAGQLSVPGLPPGVTAVDVDATAEFSLALLSDGTILGWGDNSEDQLAIPSLPPGTTWLDVSAGGAQIAFGESWGFASALRSDGRVIAWGFGGDRQLGVPAPSTTGLPIQVSESQPAPDLGGPILYGHTAVLRSDGQITLFGDLSYGRGNVPALAPGETYVQVSAGGLHMLALRSSGTIAVWGNNSWNQANPAPALPAGTTYVEVSASSYFNLARRSDGQVVGWGFQGTPTTAPALPPGTTYVAVRAGGSFGAALRSDGQIVAWGSNVNGERNVPQLPPGRTYVEFAVGYYHGIARRDDGVLVGWGWNYYGQATPPPAPPGVAYVEIAAGSQTSAARRSDGQIVVWGHVASGQADIPAFEPGEQAFGLSIGAEGLAALVQPAWSTYGVGKPNSLGCVPAIRASGYPSASATAGFVVEGELVRNQSVGMLIYTVDGARASTPFQCGTLWIGPNGLRRSPVRSSGGTALPPNCSGVFSMDVNAFAAGLGGGAPHPALSVPGTVVHAQWLGRDAGFPAPCNTTLSDAIEWHVRP